MKCTVTVRTASDQLIICLPTILALIRPWSYVSAALLFQYDVSCRTKNVLIRSNYQCMNTETKSVYSAFVEGKIKPKSWLTSIGSVSAL